MDLAGTPGQRYSYRALDADGVQRTGHVTAPDEASALRELIAGSLTPIDVRLDLQAGGMSGRASRGKVTAADRIGLLQELGTLLQAGVSLHECLPSIARAYRGRPLGDRLERLNAAVTTGQRLPEAMVECDIGLPAYAQAIVDAGEAGGRLSQACLDAASQLEHDRKMGQELRNALIYPVILVVVGIAAVGIIFIAVVPRFASLLKSARADVPALSRWIIEAGVYTKQHVTALGLVTAVVVGGLAIALSNPQTRTACLNLASRLPVIGSWLRRREVGRWATVLGSLLGNRVPIIQAIGLSSGTLRLKRMRDDMETTARELERGKSLADILGQRDWFPPTRLNLVSVGERSGELPRMLATLGAMETDVARDLQRKVLALIEPVAILLIGGVIGVVMVAVMMAITSLNAVAS